MFKRILSITLVALLFTFAGTSSVYAKSETEKAARLAEKVKEGIGRLGTGPAARVEVKLKDKSKVSKATSVKQEKMASA